jgi:3-demethoxyubiquinol 3-hydroxylase
MQELSFFDQIIHEVDSACRTLHATKRKAVRNRPDENVHLDVVNLTEQEKHLSGALLRVDHAGEICAQALYHGQAAVTRSSFLAKTLLQSAEEENDHLAWCEARLNDLGARTSYLNPLWYGGSFAIGAVMGMIGDEWSLGFIVETENQVVNHLESHLKRLPENDYNSRVILEEMITDEKSHASLALQQGARELPGFVKKWMAATSKIMTRLAFFV